MIKRFSTLILFVVLFALCTWAQQPQGIHSFAATAAGRDPVSINQTGTGISFHKITWVVSGTVSSCVAELDKSPDNSSWTSLIAVPDCHLPGTSIVVAGNTSFISINPTTVTGGGTVTLTWDGYVTNPGGGGGCIATVATLSSACGTVKGTIASVTDGTSAADCTTGSSTFAATCQYNGAAWVSVASSAGAVSSGTQGYPYVNTNGSTGNTTSPAWKDATQFSGADMCAKIDAARQACSGTSAGCFIKAPFTGKQVCNTDPFAHWNNGGVLDLTAALSNDIRTSVGWSIPPNVKVIGNGATGPGGAAAVNNTIIRAGNSAWQLGATNFVVPHEAISGGISVTGTTATVTVNSSTLCSSGSPNSGQDVFIYGGTGFWAAYHGLALVITGCATPPATSFQVQVPSGTTGCATTCSGATVYEGAPLVRLGTPGGAAQYRTQIEGVSIDCAWTLGCIPLLNDDAEEQSWFRNVNFMNFGGEAFRWTEFSTAGPGDGASTGGGASQSSWNFDFSVNFLPETCELVTNVGCNTTSTGVGTGNPLYETSGVSVNPQSQNPLNCQTLGFLVDGPRSSGGTTTVNHLGGFYSFTLTANDPDPTSVAPNQTPAAMRVAACGTPYSGGSTPIGGVIYGVSTSISDAHTEYWPVPFEVGGNAALNATFPGTNLSNAAVTTAGVHIGTINTLVNGTGSTPLFSIDIGANATDVNIEGINTFGRGNVLKDNVIGDNCADSTLGTYKLGAGTIPFREWSCGSGKVQLGSAVLLGATSGSTTLSASGTGGTLNLGSTNATVTAAGALSIASTLAPLSDAAIDIGTSSFRWRNFLLSGSVQWLNGGVVDAGLSRDAAGVVDVGNGTAGDTSGTIQATTVKAIGTNGGAAFTEGTCANDGKAAGVDTLCGNSTTHKFNASLNNGARFESLASTVNNAHGISGLLTCADTSASGSVQVCNTSPTFTPAAQDCVIYTTTTANTGAGLTLNVNSLGAKSVAKWQGTTTLAANDILANKSVLACYDGTNWEVHVIGNAPGAGGTTLTYWGTNGYVSGNQTAAANTLTCGGFVAPDPVSIGHVTVNVGTADNVNLSSVEIYNSAGTLIGSVTPFTSATTASRTFAWSQGTVTVPAGKNYFCITSVGSTFAVQAFSNNANFYPITQTGIATSGGAAPASITPPSDVLTVVTSLPAFELSP